MSFLPSEPPAALGGSVQVLVFERHAASRIGYGLLLRRQPWIASCLLADERDDAVAIARRTKPDVALIDISDVGPFVAAHIAPLREAHPGMAVVLSTRDCGPQRAPLGAFAGAPLLTAESSSEEVVQAVRSALIEDTSTTAAASAVSATGGALLSEREREVLALLCTGATNREIAAAMHVSAETVKKHAATLYRKLGVRNRTEAAQRAPELLTA